jgi:hypothetical protein
MHLTTDAVSEISRIVAAEQSPDLDVVAVLSSGGSDRIELLLAMASANEEPRRYMITVQRTDATELESELRLKLGNVIRNHSGLIS